MERHAEVVSHHEAKPEDWYGYPEEGQDSHQVIPEGPLLDRRNGAESDSNRAGQNDGGERELDGVDETGEYLLDDGSASLNRLAQIAASDALQIIGVLNQDRLVESELVAGSLYGLVRGIAAHVHPSSIARDQLEREEDQRDHQEQDRHTRQQAFGDETSHHANLI